MNINLESTVRLRELLKDVIKTGDIEDFIKKHCYGDNISFADFFTDYVYDKGLSIPIIIQRSGVHKNYIYNIINDRRKPSRDKIIALGIGSGMNYTEVNRALEIAGEGILYPKNERDVRIILAINNRIKTVDEMNSILEAAGLRILE